ncbi:MAG: 3-hydroxybutyrate oligomer hydrolase family protein [Acidihalobacter sp.]|uniref:3-hydroxybutyrate oligomer hydrolase family protein n=1 Tax=Acidihalobacter sp. TaxID=1872108 RepID=UPI00307EAE1C
MDSGSAPDFGEIRETLHRHDDDLLSAGLGLTGLRQIQPPCFYDPARPTPEELRRRAIHTNWRAIVDLSPLGAFGSLYGGAPEVPGREYQAFARLSGAEAPHRVLLQAPDAFDRQARCLVVAASPGSRGIYGAIALAGAWGLPQGFAVAYTDKGAGTGYFDAGSDTGVRLDGTRAHRGEASLEFEPAAADCGVGIKHAHSGDNPEARWGDCVLQAVDFGLAMLERAYPNEAPFTAENTRIIAVGLSNGGGAVLQAAGRDSIGALDGVIAVSPNIYAAETGRPFYDYASEASLLLSSALAAAPFREILQARFGEHPPYDFTAHGEALSAAGLLDSSDPRGWPQEALERLLAAGWGPNVLQTSALINELDLWRPAGATYASSYLRRPLDNMPCDFDFEAVAIDGDGHRHPTDERVRAAWWSDAHGIPPGAGVVLPPTKRSLIGDFGCLRKLWTTDGEAGRALRDGVAATAAQLPRNSLPIWVVHGHDDGLIPINFSSDAYVAWLRANGRDPVYWEVPYAQHFDALLAWPALGMRYLPMMPYVYSALDSMLLHLREGTALPHSRVLDSRPRGEAVLEHGHLGIVGG